MDGTWDVSSSALLLSGGMDSLCLAAWKRPRFGITIDYGQLAAAAEISASASISALYGIEHHVIKVDCRSLGTGDMAGQPAIDLAPASDWWPYRNQLLVTLAATFAVTRGIENLIIGTVATDAQHRDGSPEFVAALNALLQLQEGRIVLHAPAIGMTTSELIRHANVTAGELAWAHSCHRSNVLCGACRGCNKYLETWLEMQDDLD